MAEQTDMENKPMFALKAFSVDYIFLKNAKTLEREPGVLLLPNNQLNQLRIDGGNKIILIDELKVIQVVQMVSLSSALEDNQIKLFEVEIAFDFMISNYSEFRTGEKEFSFAADFFTQLTAISFSSIP